MKEEICSIISVQLTAAHVSTEAVETSLRMFSDERVILCASTTEIYRIKIVLLVAVQVIRVKSNLLKKAPGFSKRNILVLWRISV